MIEEKNYLELYFPWLKTNVLRVQNNNKTFQTNLCDELGQCHPQTNNQFISEELIKHINKIQPQWRAGINMKFQGGKLGTIMDMMQTVMYDDANQFKPSTKLGEIVNDLPDEFDVKEKWPDCKKVIGTIRDQSNCSSGWAFGSTEVLNDRLCIKHGYQSLLSVADTIGCCGFINCMSRGCSGGQPAKVWDWFQKTGVVSGGDQGDKTTCQPYTMPPCTHTSIQDDTPKDELPDCSNVTQDAPKCNKTCSGLTKIDQNLDKHKSKVPQTVEGESALMNELYVNGPITVSFYVQEDFLLQKSGVYKHMVGKQLGGHTGKLIGWGIENGQKQWLVQNSWNDTWGENGLFKILRGTNECGIETHNVMGSV